MKSICSFVVVASFLIINGCGNDPEPPEGSSVASASGAGGQGSAASAASAASAGGATSSSSASSGTGGAGGGYDLLAPPPECATIAYVIPLDGEFNDENGVAIHEDGALAIQQFTPPKYPFTITGWTHGVSDETAVCGRLDYSAVWFVAPSGKPPASPKGFTEVPITANSLTWQNGYAFVDLKVEPGVTLQAGESFWAGVRVRIQGAERTCVAACRWPKDNPLSDFSWYSNNDAQGNIAACPGMCDLEHLAESPTIAVGKEYNADLQWKFTAVGQ